MFVYTHEVNHFWFVELTLMFSGFSAQDEWVDSFGINLDEILNQKQYEDLMT